MQDQSELLINFFTEVNRSLRRTIIWPVSADFLFLLLRQLSLEYFIRSNEGESQGRKPQEYWRISRFSDVEFLLQDKQKNSRFSWWSNNSHYLKNCNNGYSALLLVATSFSTPLSYRKTPKTSAYPKCTSAVFDELFKFTLC